MKRFVVVLLVTLNLCLAQTCDSSQSQDLMPRHERTRLFAQVWETVNDEYIYDDFRGIDWQAARKDYGKLILHVKTNAEFYRIVDAMIFELGDDHSIYLPPWSACEEDHYDDSSDSVVDEPTVRRLESHPEVLWISLPSFFLEDTSSLLEAQLRKTLQKGKPTAIILDLRHNYGGYIHAAYEVLSHFVRGRLATEFDSYGKRPKRGEEGRFYRQFNTLPMVVLVDANTNSAAELTAGILQQTHGAVVLGQPSAGNTEIILPFEFQDGSRLWLAVGGFTLADGTNLEGVGVIPDVMIEKTAKEETYLEAGLEALGLSE